eukprot:1749988-Pleurochrysis_carterae.AAC.6
MHAKTEYAHLLVTGGPCSRACSRGSGACAPLLTRQQLMCVHALHAGQRFMRVRLQVRVSNVDSRVDHRHDDARIAR